jgi:hypothetical protein
MFHVCPIFPLGLNFLHSDFTVCRVLQEYNDGGWWGFTVMKKIIKAKIVSLITLNYMKMELDPIPKTLIKWNISHSA